MQLNDSELREYTHGTFACIAKVLGPDFVPYLQRCMDLAATSIELVGDLACQSSEWAAVASPRLASSISCRHVQRHLQECNRRAPVLASINGPVPTNFAAP